MRSTHDSYGRWSAIHDSARFLSLSLILMGCTPAPHPPDTAPADAGPGRDVGRIDGGADAGMTVDGSVPGDAGTLADIGLAFDAGGDAGPTPITATTAANEMTCGFNVGNTFETNQHPRIPMSVNAMIDAYYAQGYRMVRLPVRWLDSDWGEGSLADDAGVVNRDHPRLASMASVIDHALERGMYVVLDAHHEDWLFDNAWSPGQLAIFRTLWTDICEIFADRGYGLVFEVVNEPHGTLVADAAAVRSLNQTAYDVIRDCGGHNAERIIVIDGDDWGSPASLRITWPSVTDIPGGGDDPYLMGSIHYYSPTALTHASNAAGIDTAWTVESIGTSMDRTVVWADGRLPIYVGELGVNWNQHAHTINDNVRSWYTAVASETRDRGWAFALWDDGGWFRVMNRSDQTFNGLEVAACTVD